MKQKRFSTILLTICITIIVICLAVVLLGRMYLKNQTAETGEPQQMEASTTELVTEEETEAETEAPTEAKTEAPTEAVSKNVFAVLDMGWFILNDDSIMNMTKDELEDALDLSLAEPEYFPWLGNDLCSIDITYNGIQICLMFQNERLVIITHDIMGISWNDSVWNEAVNRLDYTEKEDGYGYGAKASWNYYYRAAEDCYAETGENCMKQYYISYNYS
ncbi:MAG: hypothetical protein LUC50_02415 [Ruminococcus sp.]|nr:hypothetical protein [Ruminococcus sp.]